MQMLMVVLAITMALGALQYQLSFLGTEFLERVEDDTEKLARRITVGVVLWACPPMDRTLSYLVVRSFLEEPVSLMVALKLKVKYLVTLCFVV